MAIRCLPDFQTYSYRTQSIKRTRFQAKAVEHSKVSITSSIQGLQEHKSIQIGIGFRIIISMRTVMAIHIITRCHLEEVLVGRTLEDKGQILKEGVTDLG
jgi:hypothetical protein